MIHTHPEDYAYVIETRVLEKLRSISGYFNGKQKLSVVQCLVIQASLEKAIVALEVVTDLLENSNSDSFATKVTAEEQTRDYWIRFGAQLGFPWCQEYVQGKGLGTDKTEPEAQKVQVVKE